MHKKILKISLVYLILSFANIYASNNNMSENELLEKSTNVIERLRESKNDNLIGIALISWDITGKWNNLSEKDFEILATIIIDVAKEKGTLLKNKPLLLKIAEKFNFSKEILNENSIENNNFITKNKESIFSKNEKILNINFESSQIHQNEVFKNVKSDIKKLILCGGKQNESQDPTDESWFTVDFSPKIHPDLILDLTQQSSYETLLKEGQYDVIFEEYGWAPARHVILKNVKYLLKDKGIYVGLFCLPFEKDENKRGIDFNHIWLLINNIKDKAEKGTLGTMREDMFKKQRDFVLKIGGLQVNEDGGQQESDSLFKKISQAIKETENKIQENMMKKEITVLDVGSTELADDLFKIYMTYIKENILNYMNDTNLNVENFKLENIKVNNFPFKNFKDSSQLRHLKIMSKEEIKKSFENENLDNLYSVTKPHYVDNNTLKLIGSGTQFSFMAFKN